MLLLASEFSLAHATERVAAAGASTTSGGWRASLFVTGPAARDENAGLQSTTTVGARLSRSIAPGVRLSLDVFNVFDQRTREIDAFAASRSQPATAIGENYLFHPSESRGVRVGVRFTFK